MFTRTHTRLSAWLAMLALVWGALAPTLAPVWPGALLRAPPVTA